MLIFISPFCLPQDSVPTCINYSPNGNFLAVATKLKKIHMYYIEAEDWQARELDVTETEKAKPEILQQVFSSDSKHLAVIDSDFSVTLFAFGNSLAHILGSRTEDRKARGRVER